MTHPIAGDGPLTGIRILDFSRVLSGPIAGRNLHDLGADVIKVEPPEGDLVRFAQPKVGSISLYYAQQNTGKRNISLDLRHPDAPELVGRLAETVDVVLENYRPGVMDRLGIGWDALAARNPRLIMASISGYGQTGRWRDRRAYAVVIHAEMGLIEAGARWRADAAGTPETTVELQDGMSHADVYAGLHLTSAILAALFQRERTGVGQWVEVDMAEALLHANDFTHWDLAPTDPGDYRPTLAPPYTPIVRTGAGPSIVIAGDPAGPGLLERYAAAMQQPELLDDPRFALAQRRAHRADLIATIEAWTLTFTNLDELEAILATENLPMGIVRSPGAAARSEWSIERGAVVDVDDRQGSTVGIPEAPWRFSGATTGAHGVPAYRGEHNREVLRELLDVDDATLERWESGGLLSARVPR
ncbi:MAG: CoA transferase [Acidimicrobiia bacterium]|nr:CoA transferase [Acidimicrobiia bacterium]